MLLPPPEPLRVAMDERKLAELAESIKRIGITHNLCVGPRWGDGAGTWRDVPDRKLGDFTSLPDKYEIFDGHRRYLAAELAGLEELPVMVFEGAEDARLQIMLDSNVCAEDVTPFEEGVQFLELATKYNWSMDDLQRKFGKSEDYINDRVDIVRKDQLVAEAVRDRRIGIGQAKEILKCATAAERAILVEQAAVHGATIAGLREMRHTWLREAAEAQGALPMNTPGYAAAEPIISPDVCPWCGRNDDVANMVILRVHQYELADLKAVLDKFSLRGLREQLKAQP